MIVWGWNLLPPCNNVMWETVGLSARLIASWRSSHCHHPTISSYIVYITAFTAVTFLLGTCVYVRWTIDTSIYGWTISLTVHLLSSCILSVATPVCAWLAGTQLAGAQCTGVRHAGIDALEQGARQANFHASLPNWTITLHYYCNTQSIDRSSICMK